MVLRLVSVTFADRTNTIASPHVEVLEEHKQMRKKGGDSWGTGEGESKEEDSQMLKEQPSDSCEDVLQEM